MRRTPAFETTSQKHDLGAASAGPIFSKFSQNTRHLYLGKFRTFQDDRRNGSEAAGEKLPEGLFWYDYDRHELTFTEIKIKSADNQHQHRLRR